MERFIDRLSYRTIGPGSVASVNSLRRGVGYMGVASHVRLLNRIARKARAVRRQARHRNYRGWGTRPRERWLP